MSATTTAVRRQLAVCRCAIAYARASGQTIKWPITPDIVVREMPASDGGVLVGVWQWARASDWHRYAPDWRSL